MNRESALNNGIEPIKLANGEDRETTEFMSGLRNAALKLLRTTPKLDERTPELERKLRGLVNSAKLKAPAGLAGRALDTRIVEAAEWSCHEVKRQRTRGHSAESDGGEATVRASDGVYHGASTTEHARPFPDECIRGSCTGWIATLEPRGEWPRAFLFEEWRMIHSMAIGRSAWYGSGKQRFPHCHDLLIGESGITHKNTSIYRAVDLIRLMRPNVCVFDNVSSIEGVLEELDEKRQSIALIAAGEYSYLVATGKRQGTSNIIPMLNHAYDGVDPLTITRKKAPIIREPFLNLVAGCTPAWIAEYADKEGADLGRFNRCMIFYADQDRDIPNPRYLTTDERKEFAERFNGNLAKALNPIGEITFEPEASGWFEEWFFGYRRRLRLLPDNLRKLLEREDDQVRIQAIIYAAADGRRSVNRADIEAAAKLVQWSGDNKLQLFADIEFNTDQRLERRILAWVDRGGGTLKELWRDLGNLAKGETVHRKLAAFAALGLIALSKPLDDRSREPLRISQP